MSGDREPDAGLVWTGLDGWFGLPDVRGTADAIPGGHGRFRRRNLLRDSRVITLTGHIYTRSNRDLHEVLERLTAALAVGAGPMKVATPGGTWERWVEIDTFTPSPDRGRRWTKFTVDMLAPDPRRYGPLQTLGPVDLPVTVGGVRLPRRMPWNFGSATEPERLAIPNAGSEPIHPELEVSGGFSRVLVLDVVSGRSLELERTIPPGESVVFDTAARRATSGGVDVTRWMTRRQWFEIPAGQTHTLRFEASAPEGSPQMWARFKIGAW